MSRYSSYVIQQKDRQGLTRYFYKFGKVGVLTAWSLAGAKHFAREGDARDALEKIKQRRKGKSNSYFEPVLLFVKVIGEAGEGV